MNCQHCHEPIEAGAIFCGNCGQRVQLSTATQTTTNIQPSQNRQAAGATPLTIPSVPNYALATASQQAGRTQALLALICGIIGILGGIFIPLVGIALGVFGVVMYTASHRLSKRILATFGLVVSILAIGIGLAMWVYNVQHDPKLKAKQAGDDAATTTAAQLATPCYSIDLIDKFNLNEGPSNCDVQAFNGQTFDLSTDVYEINAQQTTITNPTSFTVLAKQAIEADMKKNLSDFSITSEQVASFAGSPAYAVNAVNGQGTALIEEAVLRQTTTGDNVFILIHAVNGPSVNLQTLEAEWQWK